MLVHDYVEYWARRAPDRECVGDDLDVALGQVRLELELCTASRPVTGCADGSI